MLSTASDCGKTNEVALESRFEGDGLAKVLLPGSAYGNTVTIRVAYTDNTDGVTYYTDYLVSLKRSLSLKTSARVLTAVHFCSREKQSANRLQHG